MKQMTRNSKETETFASIRTMTMKTTSLVTLFAAFSFIAIPATSAMAYSFNGDSKHGSTVARSTSTFDEAFYAKYSWLTSDDNQPDASTVVNHIVVSLADQRLYAYHDQQLVAWSNVSTGRPGHETPTGDFTVSQKDVDHHSSLYDDASMPYFMRLTDGGVGLHAGFLPGYPASHGCVRLPIGMAHDLFQHVEPGTPVDITGNSINATVAQNASANVQLVQN
jgi:lipoprotein-anchoring transpeptidase ErfK/SrfK